MGLFPGKYQFRLITTFSELLPDRDGKRLIVWESLDFCKLQECWDRLTTGPQDLPGFRGEVGQGQALPLQPHVFELSHYPLRKRFRFQEYDVRKCRD